MTSGKPWTLTGAARSARDARLSAIRYMRTCPLERDWQAAVLAYGHESRIPDTASPEAARALFFSTLGYPPPYPATWQEASAMILNDEARYLAQAGLYVLTPEMADVVAAAAQTLSYADLSLLRDDDLPGPAGLVVLPQPLRTRRPTGSIEETRAFTWRLPWHLPLPAGQGYEGTELPAVRMSAYTTTSARRANPSFRSEARRLGAALPPILLDGTWSLPLHAATAAQRHDRQRLDAEIHRLNTSYWEQQRKTHPAAGETATDYTPGSTIDIDEGSTFGSRFMYAFWRMCEQQIAAITTPPARCTTRKAAPRPAAPPDVRIVALRRPATPSGGPQRQAQPEWHHRWVVRMHKVNQWYPSLGQHRVLFRGPYLKGPADKSLLGGDVVRGLVR